MSRLSTLCTGCTLGFVVACSSAPPPSKPPGSPPPAAGSAVAPNAPAAAPGIGEPCGDGDACADGLTCIRYFGIAGPRGPEFRSCEIQCSDKAPCPDGRSCVTVADGPGQVCR